MISPNRKRTLPAGFLALLFSLLLSGCSQPGIYGLTIISAGELEVAANERLHGDVLLVDGALGMQPGSQLLGNLFIFGGRADIDGEVLGSVTMVFGELSLGQNAHVYGDLLLSGGAYAANPRAVIEGEVSTAETLVALFEQEENAPTLSLRWFVPLGLLYVLITYVFVRYRPRPVLRIQAVFREHTLAALALGLLGWVVLPSLLLLMVFTLVLLPVALLLGLSLLLTIFFGWIAFSLLLGERLSTWLDRRLSPETTAAVGAGLLLAGLYLVGSIPLLNVFITGLLATLSLGAILLTRFGLTTFSPPVDDTPTEMFRPES